MASVDLPYVTYDPDPKGRPRWYVRKRGHPKKYRLPGRRGDPQFMAAYNAARAEIEAAEAAKKTTVLHGSLRWLARQYCASGEFKRLADTTRNRRRAVLKELCDEPSAPGDGRLIGDMPAAAMTPKAVRALRDRCGEKIEAGNFRVRVLRALFRWAVGDGLVDANPARDVPLINSGSEGFATWEIEHVRQYEARWPIGTKQRLAMALLLFTGARRADAVVLGRQHWRNGWLRWTCQKGRKRKPVTVEMPMLPELQAIIEASETGDLAFLVTQSGAPYTPAGFGNAFRRWCDAAGLEGLSAHGLRKAGACIAAENGATEQQLMAIFGWKTAKQAGVYTRKANRRRMAGEAIGLIRIDDHENEPGANVSHAASGCVSHE